MRLNKAETAAAIQMLLDLVGFGKGAGRIGFALINAYSYSATKSYPFGDLSFVTNRHPDLNFSSAPFPT